MLRALSFDAAGTLIQPAEPVAVTYTRILADHGHRLTPEQLGPAFAAAFEAAPDPDYSRAEHGDLAERKWWRQLVDEILGAQLDAAAFEALFEHYASPEAWTVFPDARPALAAAEGLGLKLVVVSNFDLRLHRILAGLGLDRHFDHIITSADARARKPSPVIFRHALQKLGLGPHEISHVGDSSRADLEGATTCGITGFLLERPQSTLANFIERVRDLVVK